LSHTGPHNHMRDLRILFNNIKDHYNDEDLGIVVIGIIRLKNINW